MRGEGEGPAEKRRAQRRRHGGTEAEAQRHGGEGRRRRGGHGGGGAEEKGTGTEAGEKNTGEKGKRRWVTGEKVLGCQIRAPARNDKGGRPY